MVTTFLTIDDYRGVCDTYELDTLTANTDNRLTCEAAAIEHISSYIRHRYDVTKVFSATGSERNPLIVQCAVNITLYLLSHRLPQSMGHERRECLYNDSISWLRDVQNSKASPLLPTYTDETTGETDTHNPVRFGSGTPNRYDY